MKKAVVIVLGLLALHLAGEQQVNPGGPLPGVTSRELELFRIGREDFMEVETAEEGLDRSSMDSPAPSATTFRQWAEPAQWSNCAPVTRTRAASFTRPLAAH